MVALWFDQTEEDRESQAISEGVAWPPGRGRPGDQTGLSATTIVATVGNMPNLMRFRLSRFRFGRWR